MNVFAVWRTINNNFILQRGIEHLYVFVLHWVTKTIAPREKLLKPKKWTHFTDGRTFLSEDSWEDGRIVKNRKPNLQKNTMRKTKPKT